MDAERIVGPEAQDEDRKFDISLRPRSLDDFVGQARVLEQLRIAVAAARQRDEALDHVLLYGPPGLGKTTLATIIAREMDAEIDLTSGPVLQKKLDLTGALTTLRDKQVFFIDEIHRLLADVEEMLYSALEDFRVDVMVGAGPGARLHSLPTPPFTAIGATTRAGLLTAPLRGRFGLTLRLEPYGVDELERIVRRSAHKLEVPIDDSGALAIAQRSRGTPRTANRLLRRVRDYAQVRADGTISEQIAQTALDLLGVDRYGLDEIDHKVMETILAKYGGGPVGLNTIAASVGEDAGTIEDVYEPFLMQLGFLDRSPRGRVGTQLAFEYFKIEIPRGAQPGLRFS